MKQLFGNLARSERLRDLCDSLRQKRLDLLLSMLRAFGRPVRILDVGGTDAYWTDLGEDVLRTCSVTVLNSNPRVVGQAGIESMVGDARDLGRFADDEFDIVYSNSVIEHVGDFDDQQRMADEVRRVGQAYVVQTPNRYFPIEPHFYVPFFQFMFVRARAEMLRHFDLGWYRRTRDLQEAIARVESVRLLSKRQVRKLFPEAALVSERLFGLEKSFTAYHLDADSVSAAL